MRFNYQYRTSENELKSGVVSARTRDEAYAVLKERGIRPSRVVEAPGVVNKVLGKGKRWILIAILVAITLNLLVVVLRMNEKMQSDAIKEDRAQLYGDPVVINECESVHWSNVFERSFDCLLASYAIPAKEIDFNIKDHLLPTEEIACEYVTIYESEMLEITQMKRMVNGMKSELREYLRDGGTLAGYVKRLDIRQRAERKIFETVKSQILKTHDADVWREKNLELRAMGLPMILPPEIDEK